jgi:hypothetical protein
VTLQNARCPQKSGEDNETAVLPLGIIIAEKQPPVRWCGLSFQVLG